MPYTEDSTESTLILQIKQGSKDAFKRIYEIYSKPLYAYALRHTNVEDAKELLQDTFLQLWSMRENIHQGRTLQALLFTMLKNKLFNIYRSKTRSPIYVNIPELATNDTPHTRIEYEESIEYLKKAICKLPKTQQRVIKLSRWDDMNNKQIALVLSLSEQTVKNQLSLGLKNLYRSYTHSW